MKNLLKNVPALITFLRSRTFAVGLLSAVLAFTVYSVSMKTYAVYIKDGDEVMLKFTMEENPEDILEEHGITTIAADVVDFSGFIGNKAEINITRAFPVSVTADGNTKSVMMAEGTVADALSRAEISIDNDDEINKELNKPVEKDDELVVKRVEYTTTQETVSVPFETVEEKTASLISGVTKLTESGENGERVLTYRHKTVDGVAEEPELIGDEVIKEPKSEKYLVGTKNTVSKLDFGYTLNGNVPSSYSKVITNAKATGYSAKAGAGTEYLVGTKNTVSKLDFGYTLNGNVPSSYSKVITNAKATGYSAKAGAGTASGRPAMVGHVAVNPNVIPYGTKLYITSADGSFVYGYAIAADTGTALMDGRVDVDLFYNTYAESCQNGVKWVNIYILN